VHDNAVVTVFFDSQCIGAYVPVNTVYIREVQIDSSRAHPPSVACGQKSD